MKILEKALLAGLILSMVFSMMGFSYICNNIENKVLRLHVLANSDSAEDQDLKLKVRDKVLEYSGDIFSLANTKDEAEKITSEKIDEIRNVALEEIHNLGYDYDVKVELTNMYFNTRHYENVTLPAGQYDALRIIIGSGKGKNWWCVMFPSMCIPAATEEQKDLSKVLNEEEIELVENEEKYEVKFKCIEAFEFMKDYLENLQDEINDKYAIEI